MYESPERYLVEAHGTTFERISDDKYAAQLNLRKSFETPVLRSVQCGARHTDKTKEREYGETRIGGPSAGNHSRVKTRALADSRSD